MTDDISATRYGRLAAEIRAQIADGTLQPGDRLPSYRTLAAERGIDTHTARDAIQLLNKEGLVVVRPGYGSTVAEQIDESTLKTIILKPGQSVVSRMPTVEERDALKIGIGEPVTVLVVHGKDGKHVYRGDEFRAVQAAQQADQPD
ncbi:GntR family transcriptional regulator [Catenuloplanes japonicus]|uniref:GntR family transcriptional regulator n=1 Tax=Catenuloplanes japonicus TaxID=33876 RepID=UPI000527BB77|nr:GntR family transcriptional regulator [Catenuloplanes japonicus]